MAKPDLNEYIMMFVILYSKLVLYVLMLLYISYSGHEM